MKLPRSIDRALNTFQELAVDYGLRGSKGPGEAQEIEKSFWKARENLVRQIKAELVRLGG